MSDVSSQATNAATNIIASSTSSLFNNSSSAFLSNEIPTALSPPPMLPTIDTSGGAVAVATSFDVDPQILEALRSKDRLYVLKLGEMMELLITERSPRIDLNPATTYQRLLVHRCAAYYNLSPENDAVTRNIIVSYSTEGRIPARRLAELIPQDTPVQPAFQIMRRTQDRRKQYSQAGSMAGEDADFSDFDASEAGSVGGRSMTTGGDNKRRMTIEEREAAYQEARTRIFMGFEEKDKDKTMSASSSSVSVVSGSGSTSAGPESSFGDIDDSASSLAPESDWSGPSYSRETMGVRREGSAPPPKPRSLRGSAPPFMSNGNGNSRASSPSSFAYPSLYEPSQSPAAMTWDPSQVPQPQIFHPGQYSSYPYSAPGATNGQGFVPSYPYYPSYPMYPPQRGPESTSPPAGRELYPEMGYPYMWTHPIHMPPPQDNDAMSGHPPQQNMAPQIPTPFLPASPVYAYPMSGYYTPQPNHHPTIMGQPLYEASRSTTGVNLGGRSGSVGVNNVLFKFGLGNGSSNGNMGKTYSAPPQPRHAWSYGPGIGESVGPRFNIMRRQPSNNSNGSSNHRSSNNDEVCSTASSSTSSSSHHTYTSTTSSQHPLPPRPDWAVGLKPDPTLHAINHHSSSRQNGTRNGGNQRQRTSSQHSQPGLQMNDFPPLSTNEKRPPVVAGAWTNPASRTLLTNTNNTGPQGSALVYHRGSGNNAIDPDRTYERPPPRSGELYNPKNAGKGSRSNSGTGKLSPDYKGKSDTINLAEQVRSMSLAAGDPPHMMDGMSGARDTY